MYIYIILYYYMYYLDKKCIHLVKYFFSQFLSMIKIQILLKIKTS